MSHHRTSLILAWGIPVLIVELSIAIFLQVRDFRGTRIVTIYHDTVAPRIEQSEVKLPEVVPLEEVAPVPDDELFVEVVDSCDHAYRGMCVVARSAPTTTAEVVLKLRAGVVLKVKEIIEAESDIWYKIGFDEWLRYPERVAEDWYVSADVVELVKDNGSMEYPGEGATGTKKIIVDRSEQQLYAYDNQVLFMQATTSTGLELTPTPRGNFFIFRKTPTRYMQGPLPYLKDQQYYDLPGVPWTLYFTEGGAAIHGTYWHKGFGTQQSHGCVNLPPDIAKKLYQWATLGTSVVVRD